MEPLSIAIVAAVAVVGASVLVAAFVLWKGRPFAAGDVFRASRLSRSNRLFPTQVLITPSSIVHFTPRWIGRHEQSIHIAHVASVRIDAHVLFSDVCIETTGGTHAIMCRGHRKGDASRMKQLIEAHQSAYYRGGRPSPPDPRPPSPQTGPAVA
jgi:hypothetical protein